MSLRMSPISRCAALVILLLLASPARAAEPTTQLTLGNGGPWRFSGEAWSTDGKGVITPPDHRNLQSRAFFIDQGYGDFTAEFEYNPSYQEGGTGGAGLILRAQDPNHFYAVYLPWGAQAMRAKNYWASIVKVSGDGYLRSLKTALVPGVPSEVDRWYKVKVVVKGPTIDVWIDGRKAVSATDDSHASGAVGLIGYGWYSFRDVKIIGKPGVISAWPEKSNIPTHSFEVGLTSQQSQSACVAPNGDVLLASGSKMLRSKDHGRTWGAPESLPDSLGSVADLGSCMFRAKDGRLLVQVFRNNLNRQNAAPPEILLSESTDNGATWSEPVACQVQSGWPDRPDVNPCGAVVQTDDGTLIRFFYCRVKALEAQRHVATWGENIGAKAFAIRSADGGKTWSKPIELDRPTWPGIGGRGVLRGSLDCTESTGVAIGNKITALVRPIYSPYMWQCWSDDGGANWDAAVRTTFPGYGGPWVIRTQNGTLVCGHRIPHFSVNLSSDGGLNWDEGTVIDFPSWANGTAVEVEPNVLLCAYMNYDQSKPLLVQLVRVHPDRVEPVAP